MYKKIFSVLFIIVLATIVGFWLVRERKTQLQPREKVTIGMVTFPGYAPLYLAKEKGFFEGIDVELKRIESIGDIRAAMQSENLDIYAATHDIYQSGNEGKNIGIGFLAIDESHGADGVAVGGDIKNAKELRGKKVAAEPGFPPYLLLQYALDKEGMTLKDVQFIDLPTQDAGSAFASKKIDAAGIYEPVLSASMKIRPESQVLISSADTPGLIQDLLFATPKLAKENPETLKKIALGWFKAVEYTHSHPDESYEIMGKAFGIPAQEMKEFKSGVSWHDLAANKRFFNRNHEVNVWKTFDLIGTLLVKNGEIKEKLNPNQAFTDAIIRSL